MTFYATNGILYADYDRTDNAVFSIQYDTAGDKITVTHPRYKLDKKKLIQGIIVLLGHAVAGQYSVIRDHDDIRLRLVGTPDLMKKLELAIGSRCPDTYVPQRDNRYELRMRILGRHPVTFCIKQKNGFMKMDDFNFDLCPDLQDTAKQYQKIAAIYKDLMPIFDAIMSQ